MQIILPQSVISQVSRIIEACLDAVDPYQVVKRNLRVWPDAVEIAEKRIPLKPEGRVVLISMGKAALAMAQAVADGFGDRLESGVVVCKQLDPDRQGQLPACLRVLQGNHPVPGQGSLDGGRAVADILRGLRTDDLVVCLISGGGSALVTLPVAGVSLDDLQELTRLLLACGAEIGEINALRKHLDQLKGGGMARMVYPAQALVLILSDVINSPVDVIASGPMSADTTTAEDAWAVLQKYQLIDRVPVSICDALKAQMSGKTEDTLKPGDSRIDRVFPRVIASNSTAAEAGAAQARELGFNAGVLTTSLRGDAAQAGSMLAGVLQRMAFFDEPLCRPGCLIAGGETTVTLRGNGRGGRNLEVALGAVRELAGVKKAVLISFATDGEDGPTDAAGAFVDGDTLAEGLAMGMRPEDYLRENNSYVYFKRLGRLIQPGSTGTNVNDLTFLLTW